MLARRVLRLRSVVPVLAALAAAGCASASSTGVSRTNRPVATQLSDADVALLAGLLEASDTRRADTGAVDNALGSPNPFVRAYAARTIGQIGITSRAGVLRALAADVDSTMAADAAFALGQLRDTSATSVLVAALSRSSGVSAAAAWSLGELGDAGRAAIEAVLRSGRPAASLAYVLQASAKLRPVPAQLIIPYLVSGDVGIQRSAAYALTRSQVPSSTRALIALERRPTSSGRNRESVSSDAAVELRSYVARGLGRTLAGDSLATDALVALRRLVDDSHAHVRINAIRSLATYGAAARAELVRHTRDTDANARVAVAQSLGGALTGAAGDWSGVWAADTGFTYRRALLASAVRAGVRMQALDPANAQSWQRHADWHFRAAAAEAAGAGRLEDVDAIAAPLLRDADPRVRNAAFASALRWSDSSAAATRPYARAALPALLSDEDLFVRAGILDALRSHARADDAAVAMAAWRRAAGDSENDARLAALRVIASAWTADSASFGALRDSLRTLPPPADPIERAAVRNVGPLRHWPHDGVAARPHAWYAEQVQLFLATSRAGRPTRAVISTDRGSIQLVLFGSDAPLTVANFVGLARRKYYDGLAFHRVVPNFVAQDGDPRGDGSGGPGYAIRDELNRRWYDRGALGMALSGPDTGGSQYFLAHSPQPHLDGHYTVFGHVTGGLDVLDALVQGDRILRITVQ